MATKNYGYKILMATKIIQVKNKNESQQLINELNMSTHQSLHQQLLDELNMIDSRKKIIYQEIKKIEEEEKDQRKLLELEEGKKCWQEYELADPQRKQQIYNACLQKFCNKMCRKHRRDGEIKYGTKWDILPCAFKILKSNGDVYWTGKHPKGNIMKYPFEWTG